MSGEMVERVARAIWPAWVDEPGFRERCLQQARAGIKAMLDPTDEMLRRGSEAAEICDDGWETNATWMAMIYAAIDDSVTVGLPEAQKTL